METADTTVSRICIVARQSLDTPCSKPEVLLRRSGRVLCKGVDVKYASIWAQRKRYRCCRTIQLARKAPIRPLCSTHNIECPTDRMLFRGLLGYQKCENVGHESAVRGIERNRKFAENIDRLYPVKAFDASMGNGDSLTQAG